MFRLTFIIFAVFLMGQSANVSAQETVIPNFWDKHERFPKPDLSNLQRLRFLTTTDFPPFNFIDRKKRLSGFHVDLAREICSELGVLNRCQIQALPWADLEKALADGEGDAIIAGMSVTRKSRVKYDFSRPYMRIPGRFVTRKNSGLTPPVYEALHKKQVGVISGSAHEAYFQSTFGERRFTSFPSREAALAALQAEEVEAVFSDALSLSFWIASAASKDCCIFLDGAFPSEKYFGYGMAVALPKAREELVQAMDHALNQINDSGKFSEIYLRYFPISLY